MEDHVLVFQVCLIVFKEKIIRGQVHHLSARLSRLFVTGTHAIKSSVAKKKSIKEIDGSLFLDFKMFSSQVGSSPWISDSFLLALMWWTKEAVGQQKFWDFADLNYNLCWHMSTYNKLYFSRIFCCYILIKIIFYELMRLCQC